MDFSFSSLSLVSCSDCRVFSSDTCFTVCDDSDASDNIDSWSVYIRDVIVYDLCTHTVLHVHTYIQCTYYRNVCLPHGLTASMDGTILDVHVLYVPLMVAHCHWAVLVLTTSL